MTYYLRTSIIVGCLLRYLFEGVSRLLRVCWLILRNCQVHLFADSDFLSGTFLCLFNVIYIRTLILLIFELSSNHFLISQVNRVVFDGKLLLQPQLTLGFLLWTFGLNNNALSLDHFFHFSCAWHWSISEYVTHIRVHAGPLSRGKRPEWVWFTNMGLW